MKFEKNIGKTDQIVRVILALVFLVWGYYSSAWLYLVSLVLLVTAATGYCMLYMPFNINTIEKKKK